MQKKNSFEIEDVVEDHLINTVTPRYYITPRVLQAVVVVTVVVLPLTDRHNNAVRRHRAGSNGFGVV